MTENQETIQTVHDLLTDYLLEHTHEGFEEIPEIDEARALCQQLLEKA